MIGASAEEIQDINLTSGEIRDSIIEGHCIGVIIKKAKSCVVCNNTIISESKEEMVTPLSCTTTMLSSQSVTKVVCNLAIKTKNGKVQSYTCFNNGLQSFLASVNKNDISLNDIPDKQLAEVITQEWSKANDC